MECLAFEVTRKCDLDCDFCAKGKAQEMTITKEIIDKTLDEVSNMYIENLRISGGEPFLAFNMIQYLFNKIIEKHITINHISIFTNGNHREEQLINSFEKIIQYLIDIEIENPEIIEFSNEHHYMNYKGTENSKIAVVISTDRHKTNRDNIQKTKEFYSKVNNDRFCIVIQDEAFKNGQEDFIEIEGNALTNFKTLINSPTKLNSVRIINNHYNFIRISNNNRAIYISKTLSVSANGNMYVGCMMSYENIDKAPMFNIMNCQNNFYEYIDKYCWKYPINPYAHKFKEQYYTYKFLKENNIKIIETATTNSKILKRFKVVNDFYEQTAKNLHLMLPTLNHTEIETLSIVYTILEILNKVNNTKNAKLLIETWLISNTECSIDNFEELTPEWCRGFILHYTKIDEQRQKQKK